MGGKRKLTGALCAAADSHMSDPMNVEIDNPKLLVADADCAIDDGQTRDSFCSSASTESDSDGDYEHQPSCPGNHAALHADERLH